MAGWGVLSKSYINLRLSDCNLWFRYAETFLLGLFKHSAGTLRERERAGKWTLKAYYAGQMLPKLNIPLLMYICRDRDGNATHFLPVVKCTLICCATQSEAQSISGLWRQALNWLDGGEKADWLAGEMFTLHCLYVVLQDGSWWGLNVARWKSKYRGIWGPEQLEST